jgi:hypothetical protein
MLYEVTSAKHAMLCEVMSAKLAWVSLEKMWMRKVGRLEETIAPVLFFVVSWLHSFSLPV